MVNYRKYLLCYIIPVQAIETVIGFYNYFRGTTKFAKITGAILLFNSTYKLLTSEEVLEEYQDGKRLKVRMVTKESSGSIEGTIEEFEMRMVK